MNGLFISARSSRGFTLIEAMIAVAVLAVGLLAIARFQAGLVSSSAVSKARTEAIAIANDVADKLRSYDGELELLDNIEPDENHDASGSTATFPTSLVHDASGYPNTPLTVNGTNAEYQVLWINTPSGSAEDIEIRVSWDDPKSGAQTIILNTTVTWHDPAAAAAAIELEKNDPIRPTGKATYSNEEYDLDNDGNVDFDGNPNEANEDGETFTVQDGLDIQLVDLQGKVVLSLEDACNVGNDLSSCTDFVHISGRVFFDDDSSFIDTLGYDDVGVAVNDTAYCSYDNDVTFDYLDENGVAYSPTNPRTTDGGNYRFFNYTCYVGGGWYGNVAPLVNQQEFNKSYSICAGDPASNLNPPEETSRRAYRGMVHRINDSGIAIDASGNAIEDANGDFLSGKNATDYFLGSIGIADALQLPNENDDDWNNASGPSLKPDYLTNTKGELTEYLDLEGYGNEIYVTEQGDASGNTDARYMTGHNFVITADDCTTAMTRDGVEMTIATSSTHDDADASGNLKVNPFSNNPDDFYCLNYLQTDASGNVYWYDSEDSRFSLATYGIKIPECPYDPTEYINAHATIKGSIFVESSDFTLEDFVVNTSDDFVAGIASNCSIEYEDSYSATYDSDTANDNVADLQGGIIGVNDLGVLGHYTCNIYFYLKANDPDASPSDDDGGWAGNVFINEPGGVICEDPGVSGYVASPSDTRVTANTGNHDGTIDSPSDFVCHSNIGSSADIQTVIELDASFSTAQDIDASGNPTVDPILVNVIVTNNGPGDATNVVLNNIDTSFTNMAIASATPTDGTYSSGTWTIGNMAAGESETLVLGMNITGSAGDRATANLSAASASQSDYTLNDTLTLSLPITKVGESDVVTTMKLVSPANPVQGNSLTYELTVTNNGPVALPIGAGYVDGILAYADANLENIDSVPSGLISGTALDTYGGTWAFSSLAEGETKTLTIIADLSASAADGATISWSVVPYDNHSTYSGFNWTDNIFTDDQLTASFTIGAAADADLQTTLELTSADPSPSSGDQITLTYTVKNWGPATVALNDYADNELELDGSNSPHADDITLKLDSVVDNSVLVIDSITLGANTSVPGGNDDIRIGALASGESAVVTITATVQAAAEGGTVTIEMPAMSASQNDPGPNDDSLIVTLNVPTTVLTLTGTITDVSTSGSAGTLNTMTIAEVDLNFDVVAGDGSCTVHGGTSYTCTITVNEGNSEGVVLQMASSSANDDFCDYNAKITAGSVAWNTAGNALWLNNAKTGGDSNQPIQFADNNKCP